VIQKPSKPYFKKDKKDDFTKTTRSTGFYINKKSNIVHYVANDKKIRYAGNRVKQGLQAYTFPRLDDGWIHDPSQPHVNFMTSSLAFEQQAIMHLNNQNFDAAIQNLFAGVLHDIKNRRSSGTKTGLKAKTDLRLYDFLAGLSVRLSIRLKNFLD
jgi:hypothetical protein